MKYILLQDAYEKLSLASSEYKIVLPEVMDISKQEVIRLEIELLEEGISELEVTLYPLHIGRPEFFPCVRGRTAVTGRGNHFVDISLEQFDFKQMVRAFLNYLDSVSVKLIKGGPVAVKGIEADTAGSFEARALITSKAGNAGEWVEYPVILTNKSAGKKIINICQSLYGKECLPTEYIPYVVLNGGGSSQYSVKVRVTEDIPAGGLESSRFLFVPEGNGSESEHIVFKTSRIRKHPYLFLREEQWQRRKTAILKDDKLNTLFNESYVNTAENWQVPLVSGNEDYVYPGYSQNPLFQTAVAWKITKNEKYLKKALKFFNGFLDEDKGYLATRKSYFAFIESENEYARGDFKVCRAQSMGWVQEAEFFNRVAMTYDIIYECFTQKQHKQIEECLRNYMRFSAWRITDGDGNNFQVAEAGAGLLCAFVLQDQEMIERFLYGYNGIEDLLSAVLLDDGMYFEEAAGYVRLAGELLFDIVNAAENYGISLKDRRVSASYDRDIIHSPWSVRETWAEDGKPFLGMSFRRFDEFSRTTRCFKDYFDCIAKLLTDKGIMFSINDSNEQNFTQLYQKAYYLYKEPLYKKIGDLAANPELFFVLEEDYSFEPGKHSVLLTAAGFGILRDDKSQAVLKTGGHGGYHGHFDRLSLASYFKDNMTFHNNEYAWFGYDSFLFKMWVQTSMAHNMTVVDGRMQKPSPCKCVYYEEHREDNSDTEAFSAVCAQTETEWFDPPYGGQTPYPYVFPEEKCSIEGRYILKPEAPRKQGEIGEYSEPVFQRRLLILFHGYCIVWDYLEGRQAHRYDCLYHPMGRFDKDGFMDKKGDETGITKRERFSDDPFGAGQFIQNCYTAQLNGTVCLRFHDGKPCVNGNDIMDFMPEASVWRVWPQSGGVTVGKYPQREDTFTYENRKAAEGYLDEPLKKTVSFTVRGTKAEFITILEGGRTADSVKAVSCDSFSSIKITENEKNVWIISVKGMEEKDGEVSVRIIQN
ncbi:MAG: heparinase II/III family protein [Lachnospiraceae bacterium]